MTWSWDTVDTAANLVGRTSTALGNITVGEPEQTIKKLAGDIIEAALEKFPDNTMVHIRCNATQRQAAARSPRVITSLMLSIEEFGNPVATDAEPATARISDRNTPAFPSGKPLVTDPVSPQRLPTGRGEFPTRPEVIQPLVPGPGIRDNLDQTERQRLDAPSSTRPHPEQAQGTGPLQGPGENVQGFESPRNPPGNEPAPNTPPGVGGQPAPAVPAPRASPDSSAR